MARPAKGISYDIVNGRVRARGTITLIDKTKKQFAAYGADEAEAKRNFDKKVKEKNREIQFGKRETPEENRIPTLAEAVLAQIEERRSEYDRVRKREKRRESSIKRDEDVYKSLLLPAPISQKPMDLIFVKDMAAYRKWLENAKHKERNGTEYYSPTSLNRVISLVKAAVDDWYRYSEKKSPAEVLEPFTQVVREKTEADFLVEDEIPQFLQYMELTREKKRYPLDAVCADIFSVNIMTAARPGELRGLQKRDWDSEKRILSIQRTGEYDDGRTKTVKSVRKIPTVTKCAEILDRNCEGKEDDDYIFSIDGKKPLDKWDTGRKLKRLLKEAGIKKDLHWHSLRGSGGSYMLDHGMTIEEVSIIMGHASISTTQKFYAWYTDRKKRRSMELMENAF